ncbi:uncharacterized protein [Panulirus ornatus]|uniref:uncharacterized protein isoform X2 n=1 Tax=Panulirus ornatus TaxID=150431 RepID=UPI003A88E026
MQVHILRWVLFLTVATTLVSCIPKEKKNEELPKPEGWRTRPHQFGSRPNIGFGGGGGGGSGGGGGGSGGDGGVVNPSYDLSEAYNSMAASRMGGGYINTGSRSSSSNTGFDKAGAGGYGGSGPSSSASSYYGSYAPSGYGGYASESGYGYSLTKYVDCSSALAILSLILFMDVLRDVVEQLTNPNNRRRRDSPDGDPMRQEEEQLLQFIADGGVDALVDDLPTVVVPLLSHMHDEVSADTRNKSCVQRPLCEANALLADRYGGLGRVLGAFFSSVVAKAFVGSESPLYHSALEASRWGRLDTNTTCRLTYPCDTTTGPFTS